MKENYNFDNDELISNVLDPFNGWCLPTITEWNDIIFGSSKRTGSTVNETSKSYCAQIQLDGVEHAGVNNINGLLIFPDGETISGKSLNAINQYGSSRLYTTGFTSNDLNEYLAQGCVFIPYDGRVSYNGQFSERGQRVYCWINDVDVDTGEAGCFSAGIDDVILDTQLHYIYTSVYLVKPAE